MGVEIRFDTQHENIQVEGDLTAATVMDALSQFIRESKSLPNWVIDFTRVSKVDSTAIALLIELKRKAQEENREISFINLPAALLQIARLSQLEDLLTHQG